MSNSGISNATTFDELVKRAMLEQDGSDLLYVKLYARTPVMASAAYGEVWSVGGIKTLQYEERTLSVVSSSNEDKSTGTGAYGILITGLDGNYNILKESIALNGTTPVTPVNKFMRVEKVQIQLAGTSRANVGSITITETTGSTVQARIEATVGVSQMSSFTCPAGYVAILINLVASCQRATGTGVRRGELKFVSKTASQVRLEQLLLGISNEGGIVSQDLKMPTLIPEKVETHFGFTAEADATIASTLSNYLLIKGRWNLNDSTFY